MDFCPFRGPGAPCARIQNITNAGPDQLLWNRISPNCEGKPSGFGIAEAPIEALRSTNLNTSFRLVTSEDGDGGERGALGI